MLGDFLVVTHVCFAYVFGRCRIGVRCIASAHRKESLCYTSRILCRYGNLFMLIIAILIYAFGFRFYSDL